MSASDDHFTKQGAGLLAQRIESHWQERGYYGVRAWREALPNYPDMFQVRSNIIGGAPPPPPRKARPLAERGQ